MKKTDTRVQYTKMVLKKSLLELLKQKPVARVTTKELCEKAGLNRGTFYLHYSSPEELLRDIEHQFLKENSMLFEKYWNNDRDINIMEDLLACISADKEVSRIIMGPNGNPSFLKNIKDMMRPRIIGEWEKEFPHIAPGNLEFIFNFLFDGSMHLILEWLDDDQGISSADFTHRLECLGHHCLLASSEF